MNLSTYRLPLIDRQIALWTYLSSNLPVPQSFMIARYLSISEHIHVTWSFYLPQGVKLS